MCRRPDCAAVVRDEQIRPAITVVILPGRADGRSAVAHDPGARDLRECPVALVVQKHVVVSAAIRDEQVEPAVSIVISPAPAPGSRAHRASEGCDFGERAIAVVPIEIIGAPVGDEQIEPAIVVEIGPTAAEAAIQGRSCIGQLGERAIAVVVVEEIFCAAVANEQIGEAVVVEVTPSAAGGIATVGRDEAGGDFGERRVHGQHRNRTGDGAAVVGHDDGVTARLRQVDVGECERAVGHGLRWSVIPEPLETQRRRSRGRHTKRHAGTQTDRLAAGLRGDRRWYRLSQRTLTRQAGEEQKQRDDKLNWKTICAECRVNHDTALRRVQNPGNSYVTARAGRVTKRTVSGRKKALQPSRPTSRSSFSR